QWTYEVKTYETFETVEEVEEIVEEEEAKLILEQQKEVITEETTTTTTEVTKVVTGGETVVEEVKKEAVIGGEVLKSETTVVTQEEEIVKVEEKEETVKEVEVTEEVEEVVKVVTTTQETGVVVQPAVSKKTSWFRRLASGAADAAAGALQQVDGVWKRSVEVLTVRKAHVDDRAPIAKTAYVYYDDEEVFDAELTQKETGLTYKTQLLFDSKTQAYYIYILYGEEVKMEGPFETIEQAKESFLVIYKEKTGIAWDQRQTIVSEQWSYNVKTYETIEEKEVIEEVVEDYEVSEAVAKERQVISGNTVVSTTQTVSTTHDDTVIRTVDERTLTQDASDDLFNIPGVPSGAEYEALVAAQIQEHASRSSKTSAEKQASQASFLASLPRIGSVGIDHRTGAATGVVDRTSGTAEALREVPTHLRPRAWVSLHVGGWRNAPHRLSGFMRVDDQSGEKLMEEARDAAADKAEASWPIQERRLPEIVALFTQKLYAHFGEEVPEELSYERLAAIPDGKSRTW
ncbi:hypothetical protein BGW42_006480, partial [Actinomortierella wolfii]